MSEADSMALPPRPVIAVIGAGAIGAYYGGRLAQHGHDVHFLLRGDYEHVRERGWTIRSCDGDFVLPAAALRLYRDVRDMPAADLVLITLKTTANDRLPELVRPLVGERTAVLTLQNGLGNEEALARIVGPDRVMGGLAFICANRGAPGEILHTAHGLIRLGEYHRRGSQRARQVAELFNASKVRCQVLDDLRRGRWEKLVWNVPFNGLGAVLDLTTDRLIARPAGETLVRELMAEVIAAAQAQSLALRMEMIDEQIAKTRQMGAYRTSMQIDRQHGRPLEIEAILAAPAEAAEAAGAPVPRMRQLEAWARVVDGAIGAR
jgi:2-dehydropantoate 2-reductase